MSLYTDLVDEWPETTAIVLEWIQTATLSPSNPFVEIDPKAVFDTYIQGYLRRKLFLTVTLEYCEDKVLIAIHTPEWLIDQVECIVEEEKLEVSLIASSTDEIYSNIIKQLINFINEKLRN